MRMKRHVRHIRYTRMLPSKKWEAYERHKKNLGLHHPRYEAEITKLTNTLKI